MVEVKLGNYGNYELYQDLTPCFVDVEARCRRNVCIFN